MKTIYSNWLRSLFNATKCKWMLKKVYGKISQPYGEFNRLFVAGLTLAG